MKRQLHKSKSGLPRYDTYTLDYTERMVALCIGCTVMGGIGYLFYQHWLGVLLFAFIGIGYIRIRKQILLERRRMNLTQQFKQTLYSLSAALGAGRSMENALREAVQDLQLLYPGTEVDMIRELHIVALRMENREPVEHALVDFSQRANQEDITNFAEVCMTCKRTGGDLIEVVRRTSAIISEKMDIMQEMNILVAQKKLEMKALMVAPVLFLSFLNITSPDFMQALYEGRGRIISTLALIVLLIAVIFIRKLMDIKV